MAVLHGGCLSCGLQLPSLRHMWVLLYSEQGSLTGSVQHVCNITPSGLRLAGPHIVFPVLAWPDRA